MADESFAITNLDTLLPQLLSSKSKIYTNVGFFSESGFHSKLTNWISSLPLEARPQLVDINGILSEMRLRKSEHEIAEIRKACEISMRSHLRAMQRCAPDIYEFELAAELFYEFIRLGGQRPAFPNIIASGADSCILHYENNNKKLMAGDLIVVDAGVEYGYYAADISRTYPVNGTFTEKQKVIYELVLASQKAVIKEIKPGITWNHLQDIADRVLTDGLVKLGFLTGDVSELIAEEAHKKFTLHKIGHWLGLDVHDVGSYGEERKLEPGMVFTVEPGIYLGQYALEGIDCDDDWYGIGVRIEDDILVTENGYEVLTSALPKEIADVEYAML
jgi:Xaa-Pro aminopeptidase